MPSFYFLYPSHILGGCELLFARMANELSLLGHSVTILDVIGGQVSTYANNKNIRKTWVERSVPIKLDDGTLIVSSGFMTEIANWIVSSSQCKILFWCVQPYNNMFVPPLFSTALYARPFLLKIINNIFFREEVNTLCVAIGYLLKLNGLVFMDEENRETTSSLYGLAIPNPIFVPIPMPDIAISEYHKINLDQRTVQIYWVGRLVDFKIHILEFVITELAKENQFNSFCLNVVGSGPETQRIKRHIVESGIPYLMHGVLKPDELAVQLIKDCDLLFAMGTSALEGASLGIPTVLVDASYSPIKDYLFNWIHHSSGFTLGKILTNSHSNTNGMTMSHIMQDFRQSGQLHGELSRQYFMEHHSMKSVVAKFLQATSSSQVVAITYFKNINLKSGWKKKIWHIIKTMKS